MDDETKNTLSDYSNVPFASTFGEFRDFIVVLTLLTLLALGVSVLFTFPPKGRARTCR